MYSFTIAAITNDHKLGVWEVLQFWKLKVLMSLTELRSRCQQAWFLLETPTRTQSFPFQLLEAVGLPCLWPCHVWGSASILTLPSPRTLIPPASFYKGPSIMWGPLDNPALSLHSNTLNLITPTKSLLSYSQILGIRHWLYLGATIQPTTEENFIILMY